MATANILPTAESDGLVYSTAVPLTPQEADINGGVGAITGPIPVVYGQVILAVVQFAINGHIVGNNSYVVMQTDLGDGVWVDVAWAVYTQTDAPETHVLSGGGLGAMNNAFKQSRQSGGFPTSDGSNAVPIGGRIRFVGKATAVGGSSSLAGTGTAVAVTIKFKLMTPR